MTNVIWMRSDMAIIDFSKLKNDSPMGVNAEGGNSATTALQLLLRLQQSLDTEELITQFAQMMTEELAIDGYAYADEHGAIVCQQGYQNRHEIAYTLKIEQQSLGEIKFFRAQPFSEAESRRAEDMLNLLIYPLRNALRYQQAQRAAYTDPLTGLCNRSNMLHQLQREISLAHRENRPTSLLMADIDHFKLINDRYGHLSGDRVIFCVAQLLRQCLRDSDLIFRYGGEEFVIMLSGSNASHAQNIAERLRLAVESGRCELTNGHSVSVTVSIGLSEVRLGEKPMDLFARADQAMYEAKARGRNTVIVQ